MKFIGIGMIWIGFGLAVAGAAFGTGGEDAAVGVGIVGAICAMFATIAVARNDQIIEIKMALAIFFVLCYRFFGCIGRHKNRGSLK